MNANLRSIVYVSTAVREMSEFELENLLIDCRRFNLASGVTGILLYSDGSFMQSIEGPGVAIHNAFERIKRSKKHHGIIELDDVELAERVFPDFQMGYVRADRADALKASTAIWQSRLGARAGSRSESSGVAALETFWKQASQRG